MVLKSKNSTFAWHPSWGSVKIKRLFHSEDPVDQRLYEEFVRSHVLVLDQPDYENDAVFIWLNNNWRDSKIPKGLMHGATLFSDKTLETIQDYPERLGRSVRRLWFS